MNPSPTPIPQQAQAPAGTPGTDMYKQQNALISLLRALRCIWMLSLLVFRKKDLLLDHHAKTHIFEIGRFHEIHPKPYKIRCFKQKLFSLGGAGRGL